MDKLKRITIMFISALSFAMVFNEIFMFYWERDYHFWNTTNFTFYWGVNFVMLAIILQWGTMVHEQLYGRIELPITRIKEATKRLRSVI